MTTMLPHNRRGYGIFGFVILLIFLIIMWALFIGKYFSLAGDNAIASGATGLEAFLWTHINLWFFLTLLIVCVIYLRFSGGGT